MEERIYKITAEKEQLDIFEAFLKTMHMMGAAGASRRIELYVDGDGAFHPKILKFNPQTIGFENIDKTIIPNKPGQTEEPIIEHGYGEVSDRYNTGSEEEYYGNGYYVYFDMG